MSLQTTLAQLPVGQIGFGAMRITGPGIWGPPKNEGEAIALLRRAVEKGVTFIDTADSYGPGISETLIAKALHPYMQRTRTLDFCLVLDGEITLVLDTQEVHLTAGDTVVQRGTNHAWSNRSDRPCVVAFSSHDATPLTG